MLPECVSHEQHKDSSVIFCLQSFSLHHGEFALISLVVVRRCCGGKEYHSLPVLWQSAGRARQQGLSCVCRAGAETDTGQVGDQPLCRDAAESQHSSALRVLWHHTHRVTWHTPQCNSALEHVILFVQGPPASLENDRKTISHTTHVVTVIKIRLNLNCSSVIYSTLGFVWCLPQVSAWQCACAYSVLWDFFLFLPVILRTFFSCLCQTANGLGSMG